MIVIAMMTATVVAVATRINKNTKDGTSVLLFWIGEKMKGLYVHIPFCVKKCKYCDFNSFCGDAFDKEKYLSALFCEMEEYGGAEVDTVFIGGGTPTSLDGKQLDELLKKINSVFCISKNCEFTVEANPKTLDEKKLDILKKNGVNRLSLGVQSFNDDELLKLGRVHTGKEAEETVKLAKKQGFSNISIDLMCSIPSQTKESFKENLQRAFALEPTHISCYSLILEEGTQLFDEYEKGLLELPCEDTEREIYEIAVSEMKRHGYNRYEISNFAKDGFESQHNMKYWKCEEYIGVGLSAHSYVYGVRYANTDSFSDYLGGKFRSGENEVLSKEDKMSEFAFLGFRMDRGISEKEFFERFGVEFKKVFERPLSKFIKLGMIKAENGFFKLSEEAVSVSNQIMCEFVL